MFTRLPTALAGFAVMVLLSSCLDYEEEMTLHHDLSGEAVLTFHLPDSLIAKYEPVHREFSRANMEKRFADLDGVTLAGYQISADRKPVAKLYLKFRSLERLNEAIASNPPAAVLGGRFIVKKEPGRTVIERKLGEGEAVAGLPEYNFAQYKIHYDGKIAGTNSGTYNHHGQDVRYRYKLTELMAEQPVQSTTLAKAFPWEVISLCLAVLVAGVWYGWKILIRRPAR